MRSFHFPAEKVDCGVVVVEKQAQGAQLSYQAYRHPHGGVANLEASVVPRLAENVGFWVLMCRGLGGGGGGSCTHSDLSPRLDISHALATAQEDPMPQHSASLQNYCLHQVVYLTG